MCLPAARAMPAGGLECREIRDRLDIDDDDLELRLVGEEGDVVGDRKAGLVAAGDQIFRRDAALLQRLIGEDHHAAALADERDRAAPHRQRAVLGKRDEAALGADIAHAVRARHAEPGLARSPRRARGRARRPRCRSPRRSPRRTRWRCARRRRRRAASVSITPAAGTSTTIWSGGSRQRLEIRDSRACSQISLAARIDQIDRAGKFVALEIAPYARRPASRPVAGADQHDVARRGERLDLLLGRFEVQFIPPFRVLPRRSSLGAPSRQTQSDGRAACGGWHRQSALGHDLNRSLTTCSQRGMRS